MATKIAESSIYRGFSTAALIENEGKSFSTTDVQCIKNDLLNHIYTIPGERVMFPDWGTRIPLMAFEPLDPTSIAIIKEDLTMVFEYDPRVNLIDIAVLAIPESNAIVALVDVQFIDLGVNETMRLEFPAGT